jgi:hypothetical protein
VLFLITSTSHQAEVIPSIVREVSTFYRDTGLDVRQSCSIQFPNISTYSLLLKEGPNDLGVRGWPPVLRAVSLIPAGSSAAFSSPLTSCKLSDMRNTRAHIVMRRDLGPGESKGDLGTSCRPVWRSGLGTLVPSGVMRTSARTKRKSGRTDFVSGLWDGILGVPAGVTFRSGRGHRGQGAWVGVCSGVTCAGVTCKVSNGRCYLRVVT